MSDPIIPTPSPADADAAAAAAANTTGETSSTTNQPDTTNPESSQSQPISNEIPSGSNMNAEAGPSSPNKPNQSEDIIMDNSDNIQPPPPPAANPVSNSEAGPSTSNENIVMEEDKRPNGIPNETEKDVNGVQPEKNKDVVDQVNDNGPRREIEEEDTRPDLTELFAARREEELARRDRSLVDFLGMLDGYKPLIPEEVTEYYLQRSGFECSDPRLKRLLSLSAQKFISDLSRDAYHFAKLRVNGTNAGGRGRPNTGGDRNRVVLTMDDLSLALGEHGVNVKKPDYYL